VPWLIGLSNTGSWPTQTPFCTSAQIEQPTEQKGQIVFFRVISAPIACASARCTVPPAPIPASVSPPTPLARRKSRRESPALGAAFPAGLTPGLTGVAAAGLRRLSIPVFSLGCLPGCPARAPSFGRDCNRRRYG